MFKPVDPKPDFPKQEEEILNFWDANKIFEKTAKQAAGKPSFVFFEGPPTANGRPGLHHVEARSFKDIVLRFQTMKGKSIVRKAGWDTQGLPVELEVEKSLKISGKHDIENLVSGDKKASIVKFNKLCRESVWKYKDEWERFTARMGFWIDMSSPYITYENNYIESVWWILKQLWEKRVREGEPLIYLGHKVLPYCYRCGTALSSHEVAQGYKNVEEDSVFIKFRVRDNRLEIRDAKKQPEVIEFNRPTYFLSWTTTPWTLPGNVALAVGENVEYSLVAAGEENYILASALIDKVIGIDYSVLEKFPGKYLINLSYEPLFDVPELHSEASYRVYPADFVTTVDGTGIVHTAVMYGEDDYNLGTAVGLPKFHTVTEEGKFIDTLKDGLAGRGVKDKDTESAIINDLRRKGLLYKNQLYAHDYPFCWRCGTPLLYYARDSWFIRMSALRKELKANNEKINWVPEYIKHGRFGEWLEEVRDWAISRERYWGTPLPFWKCEKCGEYECVGSVSELKDKALNFQFSISNFQTNPKSQIPNPETDQKPLDLHRPYVDEIKLKCGKCGGEMRRVPEVLDVWFDSGAMPFAQWHHPFGDKEIFKSQFPADYISEAIDQTRGWFYTLLAVATAMGYDMPPYKNVICLGHVLDEQGQKMSKSKGNVIDPMELGKKYGFDIVRWYLFSVNQPGDPKRFAEADLVRLQRRVQIILWNVYNYFVTYANAAKWESDPKPAAAQGLESSGLLDAWITARLQDTVNVVNENLEKYDIFRSSRILEAFIDDLSTWYLRRSRGRSDNAFFATLFHALLTLTKLLAPFMPFFTEAIYRNLTPSSSPLHKGEKGEAGYIESVHLASWPETRELTENEKDVLRKMSVARNIVEAVLAWRKGNNFKVRQPLSRLHIVGQEIGSQDFCQLLAAELNMLEVTFGPDIPQGLKRVSEDKNLPEMYIDPILTPQLVLRGLARDIERLVQDLRKSSGLRVGQEVVLYYETDSPQVYEAFEYFDQEKTYVSQVIGAKQAVDFQQDLLIGDKKIWIGIKKG